MSSFKVRVQSDRMEHLRPAVELCMAHSVFSNKNFSHFRTSTGVIVLQWGDSGKAQPLPFQLATPEQVANFLAAWFQNTDNFKPEPDTDGTVKPGWILSTENYKGGLRMEVEWIVYGK